MCKAMERLLAVARKIYPGEILSCDRASVRSDCHVVCPQREVLARETFLYRSVRMGCVCSQHFPSTLRSVTWLGLHQVCIGRKSLYLFSLPVVGLLLIRLGVSKPKQSDDRKMIILETIPNQSVPTHYRARFATG